MSEGTISRCISHLEDSFLISKAERYDVNDLQDKPEGLDMSVLSTDSVSGLPVAPHPYG